MVGAAGGGDLGAPVMERDLDGSATEAPELPKGGEILSINISILLHTRYGRSFGYDHD